MLLRHQRIHVSPLCALHRKMGSMPPRLPKRTYRCRPSRFCPALLFTLPSPAHPLLPPAAPHVQRDPRGAGHGMVGPDDDILQLQHELRPGQGVQHRAQGGWGRRGGAGSRQRQEWLEPPSGRGQGPASWQQRVCASADCCCSPCTPPCLQLLGCLTLFMTANLLKVLFAKVRIPVQPTPCPPT